VRHNLRGFYNLPLTLEVNFPRDPVPGRGSPNVLWGMNSRAFLTFLLGNPPRAPFLLFLPQK